MTRFGRCILRWWVEVLDVLTVLWVARASVFTTVLGFLLLDMTPQAQDLFVSLVAPAGTGGVFFFLALAFVVWAVPTHYSARLLLDMDVKVQRRLLLRPKLGDTVRMVPRLL